MYCKMDNEGPDEAHFNCCNFTKPKRVWYVQFYWTRDNFSKTKYACNKVLHLTPKNCQSEVSFIALDCLNDQIQKVY